MRFRVSIADQVIAPRRDGWEDDQTVDVRTDIKLNSRSPSIYTTMNTPIDSSVDISTEQVTTSYDHCDRYDHHTALYFPKINIDITREQVCAYLAEHATRAEVTWKNQHTTRISGDHIMHHDARGAIHCDDGPARITSNGIRYYNSNKQERGGDKPAVIIKDRSETYYTNDMIMRDGNKAAIINYKDGQVCSVQMCHYGVPGVVVYL